MKKYKMLCLDIDGTLLNSEHKITAKTKEYIYKLANEKNIPVILVSARMPSAMRDFKKELGINTPMICYSGALVLDEKDEILFSDYIPYEIVSKINEVISESKIHKSYYLKDQWYVESIDKWATLESNIVGLIPNRIDYNDGYEKIRNNGVNKILLIDEIEKAKKVYEMIKEEAIKDININMSKPTYIEISKSSASKRNAIKVLLQKYNLYSDDVIAVGDNYNDMDMIEFAGIGVAMGNAVLEVKKNSNYITASNDEDGIVQVIEKYF